ncbi:ribosome-inactivating family protein [Streptomyces brasiliscabiei]|uniref:ribosome-inactivating family protein n=1 Tax=Streptomyces brasiliscabiei TaxID=2736302 RepID=UPI001C12788C|nr:ribosome-inactivating family protein [Streptomyces brasiliscabiei]
MSISVIRRAFGSAVLPAALAGALAVTTMSGLATHHETPGQIGLVAQDAPTNGQSYDMTPTDRATFGARYDGIISWIRGRLEATPLYGGITLTRNQDDYFPVTLRMGASRSVTLIFNARNLYVVGFRNDAENRYYRLGAGPANFNNSQVTHLNWLNYTNMESAAGIGRGSLAINMGSIQGSISDITNPNISNANAARALMILVQAFAEGARFDFFSYRISQSIRTGANSFYAGQSSSISSNGANSTPSMIEVTGLDFENNWGTLSTAARSATQNHTSPHVHLGSGYITTLSAIDAQLAIALLTS